MPMAIDTTAICTETQIPKWEVNELVYVYVCV